MGIFDLSHARQLDRIETMLNTVIHKENMTMSTLDDLNTAVANIATAVASAVADLSAAQSSNDDAGVEAAVAKLNDLSSQLTAAAPAPPANPAPAA